LSALDDFIAAVDAFMPLPKRIVGADNTPQWQPGRSPGQLKLLLPIEVDGEQRGQQLFLQAYPNNPTLMFSVGIMFAGRVVCRLDFELEATHGNNLRSWDDELPRFVNGPHWHKWEINRAIIRTQTLEYPLRLNNAMPFDAARQFDSTLRIFCAERHIDLGYHEIDLPPRDSLF
jgi:hypothetical protein